MPLYMDIHNLPEGTTPEDVAKAHAQGYGNAAEIRRRISQVLGERDWQEGFLPRSCAKRGGGRVRASRSSWHDGGEDYRNTTRARRRVPRRRRNKCGRSSDSAGWRSRRAGSGDPNVLFTDVVNSTTLTQSLGDEAALAILGVHDTIVRDALSGARRPRDQAYRGRNHGVVRLASRRRSLRNSDSARVGQARESEPRTSHSRSESAPPRANLSSNITICLDRQFSWPPAYALTRNRNKSWYRTRSPSCASAKVSCSKTWAKLLSKALVPRSAPTPPRGSSELDRFYLQLIADFSGRILR